jgi:hypothetical protein
MAGLRARALLVTGPATRRIWPAMPRGPLDGGLPAQPEAGP